MTASTLVPSLKIQIVSDLHLEFYNCFEQIPDDIDWVLQVDGHTDDLPIFTNEFSDNWALSTARALSVVRYLIKSGIDPKRLAANGYGEFQPIDSANTAEARQKNRRIEFKLTRRVTRSQNPS